MHMAVMSFQFHYRPTVTSLSRDPLIELVSCGTYVTVNKSKRSLDTRPMSIGEMGQSSLIQLAMKHVQKIDAEHFLYPLSISVSFHPNGFAFATGSEDKTARLFDIRSDQVSSRGIYLLCIALY
jgi:WD40 repeat protein